MIIKREVARILNKIVRESLEYFHFSTLAADTKSVLQKKFSKYNFKYDIMQQIFYWTYHAFRVSH